MSKALVLDTKYELRGSMGSFIGNLKQDKIEMPRLHSVDSSLDGSSDRVWDRPRLPTDNKTAWSKNNKSNERGKGKAALSDGP